MQRRIMLFVLGSLIMLSLLIVAGAGGLIAWYRSIPTPAKAVSINYTSGDVDRAESVWKSKKIDTYQIEVNSGGITPPPPIYVIQVWQGQIVYAMIEYRGYDGVHSPQQTPIATDQAQRYSVPGLFTTARGLVAASDPLSALKQGGATFFYSGDVKAEIRAKFNAEYGYPESISTFAQCPDCAWSSQVVKFVPFGSDAAPPTPTRRPTLTPAPSRTPRP